MSGHLQDLMREAPEHRPFMQCLARLGTGFHPSVSGFRHKLDRVVDIKQGGLIPIQNLARYLRVVAAAQSRFPRLSTGLRL